MNEQISTIQTTEVLELMRNLAPILNQKELFEFMLFSNRVLERYMPEHYNDGLSEEVAEMRKDKAWLKEKLLRELMQFNSNPNMTDYEIGIKSGIRTAMNLTEKLDEPEVEEKFYTFDNAKKWLEDNGFVVFEKDKLDEEVQRMADKTYKEMNEKPVIPQFAADYIEKWKYEGLIMHEWFTFDYDDEDEDEYKVAKWLYDNDYKEKTTREHLLIDAIRYGYEVEKEILWEIPMPDLKTSDGHIQYLTYDPEAKTYFAGIKNVRLKQTFNAKDLASVPTPHRYYAVLCDFKKIEEASE